MVDQGMMVLIAIGALLVGIAIGFLANRARGSRDRIAQDQRATELESSLEQAQDQLADYKREVFEQFGETAEKFRALNHSYEDLHQQLAKSAATLCGDAALPLLDAPQGSEGGLEALAPAPQELATVDDVESSPSVREDGSVLNEAVDVADTTGLAMSLDAEIDDEILGAMRDEEEATVDVAEGEPVPTLMDVEQEQEQEQAEQAQVEIEGEVLSQNPLASAISVEAVDDVADPVPEQDATLDVPNNNDGEVKKLA